MAAEVQYTIGAGAICTDGRCGQVTRVVVDPIARVVTDLVVEGRRDVAVPIAAVKVVDEDGLSLSLTKQEVEDLPPVDIDRPGG